MPDRAVLTAVTLNTWKGAGDYAARLALMAAGLRALRPDLVLLQEVLAVPAREVQTGETLARALGLHHAHAPARAKPRPFAGAVLDSHSGLSVLSRGPVLAHERVALPGDVADGERIAQVVRIAWGGAPLAVVNLHLTHLDGADHLRCRQMEAILAAVADDAAVLVGGDFNAGPASPPLALLHGVPGRVASDAWAAAGGPRPTLTLPDTRTLGVRCVDHLVLLQSAGNAAFAITGARRVLDTPDPASGLLPSDHVGVLVEVKRL